MGERLLCKQEVIGSIPFSSTSQRTGNRRQRTEGGAGLEYWLVNLRRDDGLSSDVCLLPSGFLTW